MFQLRSVNIKSHHRLWCDLIYILLMSFSVSSLSRCLLGPDVFCTAHIIICNVGKKVSFISSHEKQESLSGPFGFRWSLLCAAWTKYSLLKIQKSTEIKTSSLTCAVSGSLQWSCCLLPALYVAHSSSLSLQCATCSQQVRVCVCIYLLFAFIICVLCI